MDLGGILFIFIFLRQGLPTRHGLELVAIRLLSLKCWDYRSASPQPTTAEFFLLGFFFFLMYSLRLDVVDVRACNSILDLHPLAASV